MTDSLKLKICFAKLSKNERRKIPFNTVNFQQNYTYHTKEITRPIKQSIKGAVGSSMTMATVRVDAQRLPISIEGHFNLPNLITGHNLAHQTSIKGASITALAFIKKWLVRQGVKVVEARKLNLDDITIIEPTLTYFLHYETSEDAESMIKLLDRHCKNLDPLKTVIIKTTNRTVNFSTSNLKMVAYNKTNFSKCSFHNIPAHVARYLCEYAASTVRIEITLFSKDTEAKGLTEANKWSKKVVEEIFDEFLVNSLKLDLRSRTIRLEDMAKFKKRLPSSMFQSLVEYLDSVPLDELTYIRNAGQTQKYKAKVVLRDKLMEVCRIDIKIPWLRHKSLVGTLLKRRLEQYSLECPHKFSEYSFCESYWKQNKLKYQI